MTDAAKRFRLFELLANLPPTQFEGLLFAINPPAGIISVSSAAQSYRVGELLRWAEGSTGQGLAAVATLTAEMFAVEVPDFAESPSSQAQPEPTTGDASESNEWKEHLGNDVYLEMVNIPAGRFWMGSPESEEGHDESEEPVHSVTVPAFAMGRYPVTQGEWSEVAALPKVKIDLNPFPSKFKGDRLPVEQVNWFEVVEFCERLSRFTNRSYRLASEAEWEYACRARTKTPFYFGDTISTDQAKYDGHHTYGAGVKDEFRAQTTAVGSFPANAFGLHDMHGNVREWCQDVWHDNYQGAPTEGSPWINSGNKEYRVRRGGSWDDVSWDCRSAFRFWSTPDHFSSFIGFRVVCASSWTQ